MNNHLKDRKVLVTGSDGFVGKSVVKHLSDYKNIICIGSPSSNKDNDLTIEKNVQNIFETHKPDIVIHLAGQVGGIHVNKTFPGSFYYRNTMMGTLVFEYARRFNTKRLIALAAGCGYPANLQAPFKEDYFFSGIPDMNSYGYSMAKKNLIIQSMAYKEQYGFNSTILLPANLYGPNDNFDLDTSHVVPALINKFIEAKNNSLDHITIWGSGKASREFLYVEDAAKVIVDIVDKCDQPGPFNLGTGKETTIMELVNIISNIVDFKGKIVWDNTKPDGQMRRFYDMTYLKNILGWIPSTSLEDGLKETIIWFEKYYKVNENKKLEAYR